MYKAANEQINQGLSLGARVLLGSLATLCGLVMVLVATPEKQLYFYLFAAFCFCIAVACFTRGRVRQFVGSVIGVVIFAAGIAYLVAQLKGGAVWSGSRSEPSVLNALLYLAFIGIPGAVYAYKARFGFAKKT